MAPRRTERLDDRGQTVIEFTGTLPLILVTLALLWQAALVGYTFSLAGNAADKGVRAGTVGGAAACRAAAGEDMPGAWAAEYDCGADGDLYRTTARVQVPLLFPGGFDLPISIDGEAAVPHEDRGW
ncbi:TadE family protein [Streptomyces sp. NPDC051310]|jgi:pilus assembly protein CpaE|uniref:TadE family protein n=1 Tax=Streptomyces sp. NPDC051310 TaxID=3365649 RepID=UPI0037A0666E